MSVSSLPAQPGPHDLERRPACVSCGGELAGPFCSHCGEKSADQRHYDLRHFLSEAFEHLTHADNNFFRSLRLLLFRPGFLTSEFMSGRRKGYLGPVQLFLVVNLVFFIFQSFFPSGPFSIPLEIQLQEGLTAATVQKLVDEKVAERRAANPALDANSAKAELEREFNHSVQTAAKGMVIIMAPMVALILLLLEIGRKRFAVEHLVFSLHFYAFLMMLLLVTMVVFGGVSKFLGTHDERLLSAVLLIVIAIYLYFAFRQAYKERVLPALAKTTILAITTMLVLFVYRIILTVKVLHSL